MDNYMTVPDFAELVGITPAGVYNRIAGGSIDKFIKLENGVKYISADATSLFTPRKKRKVDNVDLNNLNQLEWLKEKAELLESTIQTLSSQLDILDNQLKSKDLQIVELNEQIKQLNEHLKFSNNLVDQSQKLNAADKVQSIKALAEDVTIDERSPWWKFWK